MTPNKGELTDNPQVANPLLTDDDSDDEGSNNQVNKILQSSSSSLFMKNNDPDETFCSFLEEVKKIPPKQSKKLHPPSDLRPSCVDTVAGGFSDDELCSRMSEISVRPKTKKNIQKRKDTVCDTIVGSFSDSEVEELVAKPKQQVDLLSSGETGDDEPISRPVLDEKVKFRHILPDTIIGFSESMSELSVHEKAASVLPAVHDRQELSSSESCEVISVLDSDEEEKDASEFNYQPPRHVTGESFQNCSSFASKSLKVSAESDTTVNRFFNDPPSADPSRVVSHSIIQDFRDLPVQKVLTPNKESSKDSINRFEVKTAENDDKIVENDVELAETDVSDVQAEFDPKVQGSSGKDKKHEVILSQRTSSSEESTPNKSFLGNINISTKININLKMIISMRNLSESSDLNESSDSLLSPPKQTTKKCSEKRTSSSNRKPSSVRKEKNAESASKTTPKLLNDKLQDVFHTPPKAEPIDVIDEDLQNILDSLYGETWKTPQLLRSCKSKTVRQDLRKSIHANNFNNCKFFKLNCCNILLNTNFVNFSCQEPPKRFGIDTNQKLKQRRMFHGKNRKHHGSKK